MQKMRGGMILPNGVTTRAVDREQYRITDFDRSLLHRNHVSKDIACFFLRIADGRAHALAPYFADVPHLSAAFAVEWSLVNHHGTGFAFFQLGNFLAVLYQSRDYAFSALGFIPKKFRRTDFLAQREPDGLQCGLARSGPGCARFFALAVHRVGERCEVNGNAARAQRVLSEVEREAIRIVEREGSLAVEHRPSFEVFAFLVEDCEPTLEGATKARFFELERLSEQRFSAQQLGISLSHFARKNRHEFPHQRLFRTKQCRVPHRARHDAAEHVTTALVGRQYAVGNQERRCAQMVSNDPLQGILWAVRLYARKSV